VFHAIVLVLLSSGSDTLPEVDVKDSAIDDEVRTEQKLVEGQVATANVFGNFRRSGHRQKPAAR